MKSVYFNSYTRLFFGQSLFRVFKMFSNNFGKFRGDFCHNRIRILRPLKFIPATDDFIALDIKLSEVCQAVLRANFKNVAIPQAWRTSDHKN